VVHEDFDVVLLDTGETVGRIYACQRMGQAGLVVGLSFPHALNARAPRRLMRAWHGRWSGACCLSSWLRISPGWVIGRGFFFSSPA